MIPKRKTSPKTISCLDFIAVIECECSRWVTMARFHDKDPFKGLAFSFQRNNVSYRYSRVNVLVQHCTTCQSACTTFADRNTRNNEYW